MRLATLPDRAGWIAFGLTVLTPAVIAFAVVGLAAVKTHGVVHVVFIALSVVAWATCVGVLNYGRKKYWRQDRR